MAEFRRMLFLVNAAAGLLSVSGAEITVKYVCPGDSVQAFQNIDFYRCNALVSLHITDTRGKEIARWLWQNGTLNVTRIEEEYTDRVFLDQNGTITIHNFHPFDKGNYLLICKNDTDTRESIKEVKINVMVAPSNDCKPMIERSGNKLFARLKDGDCGIPVATPYWKGDGGVSDTRMNNNVNLYPSDIIVSPFSHWLAVTPDHKVKNPNRTPIPYGLLETKCPVELYYL